jgi:diacylglycerol kinase (ATP)
MGSVAVIAHARKSMEGGLPQLREALADAGFDAPDWYEVTKSKRAPKAVRKALKKRPDVIFAWGGDGTVQRVIDTMAGSGVPLAIIPTGTANLFATNLEIPKDLAEAVAIGLKGNDVVYDTGIMNGEHFAVMAGAGADARMIEQADGPLKSAIGRASYLWTGARSLSEGRVKTRITVDGTEFFRGRVSCVLVANVGKVLGGITAFEDATPDDGVLEIGVVTAEGVLQWGRTLARTTVGSAEKSPFVDVARGKRMTIRFDKPTLYEIDGGERKEVTKLKVKVAPGSIIVRVPTAESEGAAASGAQK